MWDRVEPLLRLVERPSRYLNHEYNSARAPEDCDYRVALLYPDIYEIGQANQALAILYQIIRDIEGCAVERSYLPWIDMAMLMRQREIPLFSLENCLPIADFDLLGITLPHELAATNILEALDLAGIPIRSEQRSDDDPLILGGGPGAFNPEPIACFFDAIAIGEGEELIVEVIKTHQHLKAQGANRQQILRALSLIEGIYIPGFYSYDQVTNGLKPQSEGIPSVIRKRLVKDLDAIPVVTCPVVPYVDVAHDRLTVEILRGCTRGCRFCQAGMIYRPVRERKSDTIIDAIATGIACTGFEEVSLISLSSTDHSQIAEILRRANSLLSGTAVSVSLPSQRLDAFGVEMAQLVAGEKKTGLTFAPEAGSQRLRDIINKNVTEDDLFSAVRHAYAAGWRRCKLYFMIGLPGETDDDILGIVNLANAAYLTAKDAVPDEQRGSVRMSVSVAVFVPKPQTPFQWMGQIPLLEIQRRIE
ncbi:MAG: TIGR03960 family B12-binding radical SAM protein, partial [Coriobacteriaceae bacterium]|nr:TIGR03960 family B12-binding radical SAM protein [Coriobacteriaceae bacterium]